jgi:iron complex outermembrane receptor protein
MKNLIILFLFLAGNLFSQIMKVSGKVYDSLSKEPIPYVNISILGKEIGASTDESGYFVISGNISENDILRISHIAFYPEEISVDKLLLGSIEIFLNSRIITSQTVLIKGILAKEGITPISFSKLNRVDFEKTYNHQDIPEVLSYLPSTTFYSENGNGIGYNYLSIRGFDQRRISVSINGIPQNDPEDHNVYWLDFPDLLESAELIQVQRGAGSGIIGYPAVGGSINIITSTFSSSPKLEISSSIGSYNTRKYGISFSSGLVNKKYSFSAKLSQTLSSGYRNSSWIDFKAFHFSVIRFEENLTTQVNIYGGPIADGLAYNGIPKFAIKDKSLRQENLSYWEADNNKYLYKAIRRSEEIENFSQPHFELLNEYKINESVVLNSALFAVFGNGFFDYDGSWADTNYFRLTKVNGFLPSKNPGNALIRAMVENKQYGWIPRISINHNSGELILGGEFRFHNSIHWGSINYGENLPEGITKDYRYYYYEGMKNIISFYANENYKINQRINLLGELQIAYHNYKLLNEKYLDNEFEIDNLFLNPRIGINYKISDKLNLYLSFARITREPRLKDYYDAAESSGGAEPQFEIDSNMKYDFSKPLVKPETMNDLEFGANYLSDKLSLSGNLYYMLFDNEIVKEGQVDRFGQPITGNMEKTIHYGFEGSAIYKLNESFSIILNGSFGKNYISNGIKYFYESVPIPKVKKINLSGNSISGFPEYSFNAILKYQYGGAYAQLSAKYVGLFYSDNYGEKLLNYLNDYPLLTDYMDNKVEPYLVVNLYASYEVEFEPALNKLKLFVQINNLFDNLYAAFGIGKEFFPAAERNYLIGLRMGL